MESPKTKQWSPEEKKAAKRIFDLAAAYARREIIQRHSAIAIEAIDDLWSYELKIREWRREYQTVFQYTYSHLELCFATCMNKGWLTEGNLQGLRPDRISHIEQIRRVALAH